MVEKSSFRRANPRRYEQEYRSSEDSVDPHAELVIGYIRGDIEEDELPQVGQISASNIISYANSLEKTYSSSSSTNKHEALLRLQALKNIYQDLYGVGRIQKETVGWREKGACFGKAEDVFMYDFAQTENKEQRLERLKKAATYCGMCVVKQECFNEGLANPSAGIWGGVSITNIAGRNKKFMPIEKEIEKLQKHNNGESDARESA